MIVIGTFDCNIKWYWCSFSFFWDTFNVSIHFFSDHFAVWKTKTYSSVFIWSFFLLLPKHFKNVFLLFLRDSIAWVLDLNFQNNFFLIRIWDNLVLHLDFLILNFFNFDFDKPFIGVFDRITNKIKNNILNFGRITFNALRNIFVKYKFKS